MKFGRKDVKIVSKEVAFWTERKNMAEVMLVQMKADVERMPNLIKFQEAVIELCALKIKTSK